MEEKFQFTIDVAKNSLDFAIPLHGLGTNGLRGDILYNWNIDWGDGISENKFDASSSKDPRINWIPHIYEHPGTYTITIRPNKDTFGWMRAWGTYSIYDSEKVYDNAYKIISFDYVTNKSFMESETLYGIYYMAYTFRSSISKPANEILTVNEEGITRIQNYYRCCQYEYCIHLLNTTQEYLPSSITHIEMAFRDGQYNYCMSLIEAAKEYLPTNIVGIGDGFRCNQYGNCHNLQIPAKEYIPKNVKVIENHYRRSQYLNCVSLKYRPEEELSSTIWKSNVARFRCEQYTAEALGVQMLDIRENKKHSAEDYTKEEKFVFTIDISEDELDFFISLNGYGTNGLRGNISYDWNIDWGDGISENKFGISSSKDSKINWIQHTYNTAGIHKITIRPTKDDFGWMRAWGMHGANSDMQKIYKNSYKIISFDYITNKSFMQSETSYGDYYMAHICLSAITKTANEIKTSNENKITHVNDFYRRSQYSDCVHLLTPAVEELPQDIISIGNSFRDGQYNCCASLRNIATEYLPEVLTIGDAFRTCQYYNCLSLTDAEGESLSNTVESIGKNCRKYQFAGCINLRKAATENALSYNLKSIGDGYKAYQYGACFNIVHVQVQYTLPETLVIGNFYRYKQYSKKVPTLKVNYKKWAH